MQKTTLRADLLGTGGRDTTIDILVFNDTTDTIGEADDIDAVTSEPTGAAYARQTVNLDTAEVTLTQEGGQLIARFTVNYDMNDSTSTINAWGAVASFQSDVVGAETGQNPHLIASASVGGDIPLDQGNDDVEVTGGISLG